MTSLAQLLKKTRKSGDKIEQEYYTHVSLIKPRGRFQIEMADLESLWALYSASLQSNQAVGIAETSRNSVQAVFDIDLAQELKPGDDIPSCPLYLPEDIECNIKVLVNCFLEELRIPDEIVLISVVLEKCGYRRENMFKNGYHIQFPGLFVEKEWFNNKFLPKMSDYICGLDQKSGTVPWLLYGSTKDESKRSYRVTSVYDSRLQPINISKLADLPLFNSFGHLIHVPPDAVEYFLPRILSIVPMYRKTTQVKIAPLNQPIKSMLKSFTESNPGNETDKESLEVASRLLNLVDAKRASNWAEWIKVGWILHGHSNGSDCGLRLWIDFSKRCPEKFSEIVCQTEWSKMKRKFGLSVGTLFYWAAEDSPAQCEALKQERREQVLTSYAVSSHYGIAKYLKQLYGHEFVCVDIKRGLWYQCVRGLWVRLDEPYTLRTRLSEEVAADFIKTLNIQKMVRNIQTADIYLKEKTKQINSLIQNLRTHTFKANILAEAADKFFEPDFVKKLDCDPYLIGFQNGVYDLKLNMFRGFLAEDHISKKMGVEYVIFNENDSAYCKMLDFLAKIFPDSDIRRYFLDVYSEIFVGGNQMKQIYFWTGFGDNGKTVTQALFEQMLGCHAIKISTTLFSGKKNATGLAAPELARAAPPVRLITLEEPDSKEELNIGYLKQFSGNDKFWARDLYQSGRDTTEVCPFFKITFICNRLPVIKNADEATFNRIRVIPFESTFKSSAICPSSVEEQLRKKIFPRNSRILEDLESMAAAFAYYLLQWRKNKTARELVEPIKVVSATTEYRQRNDIYYQFLNEMVEFDCPTKPALNERDVFNLFKLWFKNRRNHSHVSPEFFEFVHYLESKWGDHRSVWPRISEANIKEQIESGKVILLKTSPSPATID